MCPNMCFAIEMIDLFDMEKLAELYRGEVPIELDM